MKLKTRREDPVGKMHRRSGGRNTAAEGEAVAVVAPETFRPRRYASEVVLRRTNSGRGEAARPLENMQRWWAPIHAGPGYYP